MRRLARATWIHWRPVCAIAGVLLVAIGGMLPSGWTFVAGLLVFLLALLREAGPSHCRKADQMTGAHWHH